MKRFIVTTLIACLFAGISATAGTGDKTTANLKAAYAAELTTSARYAAYANQAKKENLANIATMFEAASKASAIHAENHKTVLQKMGQKVDPVKPEVSVKSTIENLKDALDGETRKSLSVYAGYIAAAKAENAKSAVKSFNWAMDTGKKIIVMYKNANTAATNNTTASLPKVYWVCPKCGYTYDVPKPAGECGLCGTPAEKFIRFGK